MLYQPARVSICNYIHTIFRGPHVGQTAEHVEYDTIGIKLIELRDHDNL